MLVENRSPCEPGCLKNSSAALAPARSTAPVARPASCPTRRATLPPIDRRSIAAPATAAASQPPMPGGGAHLPGQRQRRLTEGRRCFRSRSHRMYSTTTPRSPRPHGDSRIDQRGRWCKGRGQELLVDRTGVGDCGAQLVVAGLHRLQRKQGGQRDLLLLRNAVVEHRRRQNEEAPLREIERIHRC